MIETALAWEKSRESTSVPFYKVTPTIRTYVRTYTCTPTSCLPYSKSRCNNMQIARVIKNIHGVTIQSCSGACMGVANLSPRLLTATLFFALSMMKSWYFSLVIVNCTSLHIVTMLFTPFQQFYPTCPCTFFTPVQLCTFLNFWKTFIGLSLYSSF